MGPRFYLLRSIVSQFWVVTLFFGFYLPLYLLPALEFNAFPKDMKKEDLDNLKSFYGNYLSFYEITYYLIAVLSAMVFHITFWHMCDEQFNIHQGFITLNQTQKEYVTINDPKIKAIKFEQLTTSQKINNIKNMLFTSNENVPS